MAYETEFMVGLVASFEKTEDPKKIHAAIKSSLNDESISLLEVYAVLRKRAYDVPLDNEVSLRTLFPSERV
jgi:hypothetical protein